MAKQKPKAGNGQLKLAVSYGNVNIGDKYVRVGVKVARTQLTTSQADKYLCEKRIAGRILMRSAGDADQESLPGADNDIELEATFDVKGFSVSKKAIAFGITLMNGAVNVTKLAEYAKANGTLTILGVEAIPEDDNEDADPAEDTGNDD